MRHALSPLFVGAAGGRKPLARRWVSFREPGHGFQDLLTLSLTHRRMHIGVEFFSAQPSFRQLPDTLDSFR